jgi:hypothetical protein
MFERRFAVDIILVCVLWYCKYEISYRDLAEMMQDAAWTWVRPRSCAGFIATRLSLRSGSAGTRGTVRPRGEWTRSM